jgi:hypothetical protein
MMDFKGVEEITVKNGKARDLVVGGIALSRRDFLGFSTCRLLLYHRHLTPYHYFKPSEPGYSFPNERVIFE